MMAAPSAIPSRDRAEAVRLVDVVCGALDFAYQHGLSAAEVEKQHVAGAVLDPYAHAVRRLGVFGVQQLAVHAVHEVDDLILSPHVDMVAEHAIDEKFHAHTRGEVE